MNIRCIGFNSIYNRNYSVTRKLESGTFMLILLKTAAKFTFDGATVKAPPESVILYDSTCVQEYSADGEHLICDWICFDIDGEADFFDSLELSVNTLIRYTDSEFISGLIRNVASEFYSGSSRHLKMIDSLMKTLLIKVSETSELRVIAPQQSTEPHYSSLTELRAKIYRCPQLKWNVDAMAASVNMSRSYFQHIYRNVFGVSCISDVINSKIEKAKEILSETSCTVSQVAAMCGYDNEEHFMRQFKKVVGVTPTYYRKKL